jgi:hypothetical protein
VTRALVVGDAPGGNYMDRLLELVGKMGPGTKVPHIRHDDWCGMLKRRPRPCNCNPDIEVHGPGTYCDEGPCAALKAKA